MAMTSSRSGTTALSIGACLAVAGAMVYFITRDGGQTAPEPVAATTAAAPEPAPPETRTAATAQGGAPAVEAAAEPAPGSPGAPSVDVIRVEAGGAAIVAGTARPGANVSVLAGDRQLAEVKADEAGRFVAMFEAGTSTEARALTVEAEQPDGSVARSDAVVLLLPTETPAPETPAPEAVTPATPAPAAEPPAPEVAATVLLTPDSAEVTPVAPPGSDEGQVSFASISYGESGAVTLQGFGEAGAALRVYVDGALAREGAVGADGRWSLDVPEAPPGTYTLRVDQIDAAGKVISRTETPFRRDGDAAVPAAPGEVSVVVQPGNSLWTLARIHYGTGVRYTQILNANTRLIADPDLIYPGQVFRVPGPGE
ncbi:MAG: hypothetical protein DI556_04115 [Rhodovulum sulfidophilum]|uniref:LysM domain-containing protein n=1 Tax=Rhodovulum sulfidophilum TaxID=35806 RepID=A0A2W5QIK8_RHOSU|nr:MAG: hypothetical protein DI556_04115 [Rhodovulum sulfidophilum]